MARVRVPSGLPKLRSWTFVLLLGAALALLAVIDRGGLGAVVPGSGSGNCRFTVDADTLNVRSQPNATAPSLQTLNKGETIGATSVTSAGYRELDTGRWAADQFLTPVPGTTCG